MQVLEMLDGCFGAVCFDCPWSGVGKPAPNDPIQDARKHRLETRLGTKSPVPSGEDASKCSECKGRGTVDGHSFRERSCPSCYGTGVRNRYIAVHLACGEKMEGAAHDIKFSVDTHQEGCDGKGFKVERLGKKVGAV